MTPNILPITRSRRDRSARLAIDAKRNPSDMRSPKRSAATDRFAILIECNSEQQQTALLERFLREGLACRSLIA
jgi:hypothetical protein